MLSNGSIIFLFNYISLFLELNFNMELGCIFWSLVLQPTSSFVDVTYFTWEQLLLHLSHYAIDCFLHLWYGLC
jgi:hypothetical protein